MSRKISSGFGYHVNSIFGHNEMLAHHIFVFCKSMSTRTLFTFNSLSTVHIKHEQDYQSFKKTIQHKTVVFFGLISTQKYQVNYQF